MYADRASRQRFNPGSLAMAAGANAVMVAALLYAGPPITLTPPRPPITSWDVPPDPPPPVPDEPLPERRTADTVPAPRPRLEAVEPLVERPADSGPVVPPGPPVTLDPGPIAGEGTGIAVDPPRPALPVLVQPGIDPRYAADFQPPYPAAERRAGREGRVVVRVLVGVDGRVKQLQQVSATSDAFWRATEDRAMRRWRFRPGTRDGVPVEAWRAMTLTFVLRD